MVPLSDHKFVTVDPSDILPKKKEINRYEESRKRFQGEAVQEMNKASERFNNVIIEPQKKIIMEVLHSSIGQPSVDEVHKKTNKLFNDVTDLRAKAVDHYDSYAAKEQLQNSLKNKSNSIEDKDRLDEFFEYEMLKDYGYIKKNETIYIKYDNDVDSLLWDDDVPSNKEPQSNIKKPKEPEPDSYDIDPSLFDD